MPILCSQDGFRKKRSSPPPWPEQRRGAALSMRSHFFISSAEHFGGRVGAQGSLLNSFASSGLQLLLANLVSTDLRVTVARNIRKVVGGIPLRYKRKSSLFMTS